MKNLNFSPLKKLEIILGGEHGSFATDLLDRAGVKGYTIVNNLSGKGSHGFHEGHLMFNEDDVLIMIIAAVPEELGEPDPPGLCALLQRALGCRLHLRHPGHATGEIPRLMARAETPSSA